MLKFLSVILLAAVTVSPTFAMTKMPQQRGLLPSVKPAVPAPNFAHTKRPEFLDRTHAPHPATQPMQPSRGMFNNPNEFRAPLIVVLTEMKRLGGGGLPVPNLRSGRDQNPAYMAEIQKLRELQSKLVVYR